MDTEELEPLLEKLCQGDMAVARQVFLACEPHLRRIVRRQLSPRLRAKFDSADVVQSIWADLLTGNRAQTWHFADVRRLRAFLSLVTRHRFHDKFRKHRIAFERERPLGAMHTSELPMARPESAAAALEAEELWERMLDLCPAEHQELLQLKRQGLPMQELVRRTGLHPGSIRRILRNLASRLALQESGDGHESA